MRNSPVPSVKTRGREFDCEDIYFLCETMLSLPNLFRSKLVRNMLFCTAAGAILFSCARPMYTFLLTKQDPFEKDHPVNFSFDLREVPEGSEAVANFRTYTYSNAVYCSFEELLELARAEARKLGGDFIFIEKHEPPDQNNSCHSFTATLYRTPQPGEPVIKDPPTHILAPKPLPKREQKITEEAPDETVREHPEADTTAVSNTQEALLPESPEKPVATPAVIEDVAVAAENETAPSETAENPEEKEGRAKNTAEKPASGEERPKNSNRSKAVVWDEARETAYFADRENRRTDRPDPPPRATDEAEEKAGEPRPGETAPDTPKSDKQTDFDEEDREKSSDPPPGGGYFNYTPTVNTGAANQRETESRVLLDSLSQSPVGYFSVYGGFSRRLAPLPEGLPPALETFLDETRKGHVFGAELVFRVAPQNYLGVRLDRFSSSHGEVFVVDNGNAATQGTWQENTSITFIGLNYTMTTVPSITGTHFFMGLSLGASMYKNQGTMPYEIDDEPVFVPFSYNGSTLSLSIIAGANIALADNLCLRISGNLLTGVISEMEGQLNGTNSKIEFEEGEGEGLVRGSLCAGITLAF